MMADGSLLRSRGETWGPVSPDNVEKTGVWSGSPIVAARGRAGRTNSKKDLVTGRSELFVPFRLWESWASSFLHVEDGAGP
jgi:hypothetical protein